MTQADLRVHEVRTLGGSLAPRLQIPTETGGTDGGKAAEPVSLGFALSFVSGRGLLTTRDRRLGPLHLKILELEIPDIAFPFDVTGGAERFRSHWCALRQLAVGLDNDGLRRIVTPERLAQSGFVEIRSTLRDGFIEFAGRFAVGEQQADFTFRAGLLLTAPHELQVVFYDARVYGWLPVPAALLPVFLKRGLDTPFISGERACVWQLQPTQQLMRGVLPRCGWKVPDSRDAQLVAAEVNRSQIVVVVGRDVEPSQRQIAERSPPAAAVRAVEGSSTFAGIETILGRGAIRDAYDRYREVLDDDRTGPLVYDRLLQIGSADPEYSLDTRQLADEVLAKDPENVQALLATAAIAMRERSFGEAASRYGLLAEIARGRKERYDLIAAELAAAAAATPIDPAGALQAYERAAARARDSVVAYRALFDLRRRQGIWQGATEAGERLARLVPTATQRAPVHRELGHLYLSQLRDLKHARIHFERALRVVPDDPEALEGLAETYAARGEPARAAAYLARLAEQAETSQEDARIAELNLRLGEIWHRWLGDADSAAARYMRVLDVDPRNRTARLRLAQLAEAQGELARARTLYEDVLAVEEGAEEPASIAEVVSAYSRLAHLILVSGGSVSEASACLERAVELDPGNRATRDELGRLLREQGEWGRLIRLLDEAARTGETSAEVRHSRIAAAHIELEQRRNRAAAQRQLEHVLDVVPDDAEALALLLPILNAYDNNEALQERLTHAVEACREPERKAALLFELAQTEARLQTEAATRARTLEKALDIDPFHLEAARALVQLLEPDKDPARFLSALDRLSTAATTAEERSEALLAKADLLVDDASRRGELIVALRDTVRASPGHTRAWVLLSKALEKDGHLQGARDLLLRGAELVSRAGGDLAPLHERLAEMLRQTGDVEQELHYLELAVASGSRSPELCLRLVEILSAAERGAEVTRLLATWAEEALSNDPDHPLHPARLRLAVAEMHVALGDSQTARSQLQALLKDVPQVALPAACALEKLAWQEEDLDAAAAALSAQLNLQPQQDRASTLARLGRLHVRRQDEEGAESAYRRLLGIDPHALAAHSFLAGRREREGAFEDALDHLLQMVLRPSTDPADRDLDDRRAVFRRAAAFAHELRPHAMGTIQEAFRRDFPDASNETLAQPLSELLAAEEAWQTLLRLRQLQLESCSPEQALAYHRQIADLLYRRLDRHKEAIPYLQAVVGADPNDVEAYATLASAHRHAEQWEDLAKLRFALSQLSTDPAAATAAALESALLYAEKLNDEVSGAQILRTLLDRDDLDLGDAQLIAALRKFGLHAEAAQLLETSLAESPTVEDARFEELVQLLSGPLEDPDRAALWCDRMAEAFPDADLPRRNHVDLLTRTGDLEQALSKLRTWADARTGPARATVLAEISKRMRAAGDEQEALQALLEAAAADPSSPSIVGLLVDRYTALGDWANVLSWTGKLAELAENESERNERLRRYIEIATDYADDPSAAVQGLSKLTDRSDHDTRMLAQLCVEAGEYDLLAELGETQLSVDAETLLTAARKLGEAGQLDLAHRYLERILDSGERADEAWQIANAAWRDADKLAELGRWRLARSATASPQDHAWLRLQGYAELLEAGDDHDEVSEADLLTAFASADLKDPSAAWAVYSASTTLDNAQWTDQSSRALETLLPADDPRLLAVLRTRLHVELNNENPQTAVQLAERLQDLGAEDAGAWLETALERAGRRDELLARLLERVEGSEEGASALWKRIAALHAEGDDWTSSNEALEKVAQEDRDGVWGGIRYKAGETLSIPQAQADGAEACAKAVEDDSLRATWLRVAARVRWWLLDDPESGHELLRQAQKLVPIDATAVLAHADAAVARSDLETSWHQLEEGLVAISGEQSALLWLRLADVCNAAGERERMASALAEAAEVIPDDVELWTRLADHAEALEDLDLLVRARKAAFELDPEQEELYAEGLERAEHWRPLAELLQAQAERMGGLDAANRLERAARILRDDLQEPESALELFSRSVSLAPTLDNLRAAFDLAVQLEQQSRVGTLAEPYLKRLPEDSPERLKVLRAHVRALDHLGLVQEASTARAELLSRGWATPEDKLTLARAQAEGQPSAAAPLFEEAAAMLEGQEQAEVYLEAAVAWKRNNDVEASAAALRLAFEGGLDTLGAHRLAIAVYEGAERAPSLARFLELEGDKDWDDDRRAHLRCAVAQNRHRTGDSEGACQLLEEAASFAKPQGWEEVMEAVLTALDRHQKLAELWMDPRATDTWGTEELVPRLRRAAAFYASGEDIAAEMAVHQKILTLIPGDQRASERLASIACDLKDQSQYQAYIDRALSEAADAEALADVALRCAPVLRESFGDPDAALNLLRDTLAKAPELKLAEALTAAMVHAGRAEELVEHLQAATEATAAQQGEQPSAQHVQILRLAAEATAEHTEDEAAAFDLYRRVLDTDATVAKARDFCLDYAQRMGRWNEAVTVLEQAAAAEEPEGGGHAYLVKAADLAAERLQDRPREVELLTRACQLTPDDVELQTRLLRLRLAEGQLDEAMDQLLADLCAPTDEIALSVDLASALAKADRAADAKQVLGWMADRHPDSDEARALRLREARAAGDHEALLRELTARLQDDADLSGEERARYNAEAAEAAEGLRQHEVAADHWLRAFDEDQSQLPWLVKAVQLAETVGDTARLEEALQRAIPLREELARAAKQASGAEQASLLALLARAHETAGEEHEALDAYRQLLETKAPLSTPLTRALSALYTRRGMWKEQLELLTRKLHQTTEPTARAQLHHNMAMLWRERLLDEARAEKCWRSSIDAKPDFAPSHLGLGLLLAEQGRRSHALDELRPYVKVDDPDTPTEHIVILAECLRHSGELASAIDVARSALERQPDLHDARMMVAEMLEEVERFEEAEAEWIRYVARQGSNAPAECVAPVLVRLADAALRRDDVDKAIEHLEGARNLKPDDIELLVHLRQLYEETDRWREAAEARLHEAWTAGSVDEQVVHFRALAGIYQQRLGDAARAASMLERAAEVAPGDVGVQRELLKTYESSESWTRFLVVGERLLSMVSESDLDTDFFATMARAYEEHADDPHRAREFYERVAERRPDDADATGKVRDLAAAAGDYASFAVAERAAIAALADDKVEEKAERWADLADVYLRHLSSPSDAVNLLDKALELRPDDSALRRRLADACAIDATSYDRAAQLYWALLAQAPLDVEILRIVARLAGQMGETDQAYGFYAALMTLLPDDDEAGRFVAACRAARPAAPQRSISNPDRAAGLIHPAQGNPIEEVFAPLARFAELTHPGDLNRRGITERDRLAPTDERLTRLLAVLEPLGVPQVALYLWRAGGFACEVELVGAPTIVLGSTLVSDASDRQRAFLVARSAELYRTGHTLCERLTPGVLTRLVTALCRAVDPSVSPQATDPEVDRWTEMMGSPMTDQIRAALKPKVAQYLQAADGADFAAWRQGTISSASRTAMVAACDVDEAVSALFRLRGFDDVGADQRISVLRESAEELDLFSFSVSEAHFKLRRTLGLALRRSK